MYLTTASWRGKELNGSSVLLGYCYKTIMDPILQLHWTAPWAAGKKNHGWFASESKPTDVNSFGFSQLPMFPGIVCMCVSWNPVFIKTLIAFDSNDRAKIVLLFALLHKI